ncbi:(d)CMP kinase [Chryseobacterium sp. BIGb0232]|uniref:(d)CMP kinase n=1 Tax=Chryseobacterium sp. BIGb0232 TaxID=2940598 RepID=UPI000F4A07AF|nr:(d)CMP kinase [Chryseobacterium sp. BIGb0232]MCS4302711.1 cytidylate kinase [Chryseobacterium sp. BIGb0232]ROS17365.1 cytidylate kinase [Chryseobacterium nakagawai]
MKKPVIAIDGYSSTGKSSISKIIADKLGLIHMDTGALYRGVTWFALQHCLNEKGEIDLKTLFSSLDQVHLEFKNNNGTLILYLNNTDISMEIRTHQVSDNVSLVAKQKEVRDFLLQSQRSLAEKGGVIMDGRDIGTVVLPNADYKFFLTASIDERTNRRFLELKGLGIEADKEQVKQNLIERDKIDSEREIAPLKQADDAIVIDNSELTKEETIELILSYIKKI